MTNTSTARVDQLAARAVVRDLVGAVLLLSTQDVSNPAFGTSWELLGGGMLAGESISKAVVRAIREETGFMLDLSQISAPLWHREVYYTYSGERRLQREAICVTA